MATTVDGGVDNLHIVIFSHCLGRERKAFDTLEIDVVELLTNNLNVLLIKTANNLIYRGDFVYFLDNVFVVGCNNLRAILPICLIAIVLAGVVRGSHHYTTLAAELTDGKAQLRGGAERLEKVNLEAIGGKDVGSALGKLTTEVTAVVANGNFNLLTLKTFLQIVGQTLCCHTYCIYVHSVGANAKDAPQTAGAELQVLIETFGEFFGVIIHQVSYLLLGFFVVVSVEPFLRSVENVLFHS